MLIPVIWSVEAFFWEDGSNYEKNIKDNELRGKGHFKWVGGRKLEGQ